MTDKYLHLDGHFLKTQIATLRAQYPELQDDEELLLSAIEGETNAHSIIERALAEKLDADVMAEATGVRISDLTQRKERFLAKGDAMKRFIKNIMKAAGLDKLALAEASLFITKPRLSVGIGSVEDLPQGYFKTTRQPDKAAIKAAFDRGEDIPGAFQVLGDEGLTVRTK